MKNKIVIGVMAIFAGLNILLIYLNVGLQNKVENILELSSTLIFEQIMQSKAQVMHSEVQHSNSNLSLEVFLTDHGCMGCLENEVSNLNAFHKKFNDYLQVYILTSDSSLLSQFPINFPYKRINPFERVFNSKLTFSNPLAILVDRNGKVQMINISEVGKSAKRNRFYERMESLFETAYNQ